MNTLAHDGHVRRGCLIAAVAVVLVALLPPLNTLASGVLFSAHMAQHILLLLVAPALAWIAITPAVDAVLAVRVQRPCSRRSEVAADVRRLGLSSGAEASLLTSAATSQRVPRIDWTTLIGWSAGVGAMWFWHVPALCDAAATNVEFHAVQVIMLLVCGAAFWRPILGSAADRLNPGLAVVYLFGACLACSALGILITLTPLEVCSVFRTPTVAGSRWLAWRDFVGAERDRQIGGLLMWVPMCLAYLSAIVWELGQWLGNHTAPQEGHP